MAYIPVPTDSFYYWLAKILDLGHFSAFRKSGFEAVLARFWRSRADFRTSRGPLYLKKWLLPDFERTGLRLVVDKAQIDALSESQDSLYKRVVDVFDKGIIGQGEARNELGFPVDVPKNDMVYLPSNKMPMSEE